jgi:hypothetical protein
MSSLMLSSLYDMEQGSNRILITAGGKEVEVVIDEVLSKSLCAVWTELGIQDIEAIE